MKKQRPHLVILLAVCLCAALCLLALRGRGTAAPGFVDEDAILSALEQAGLPGVIAEEEGYLSADGRARTVVVRSTEETYGDSGNPVLLAAVTSAEAEGGRALLCVFDRPAGTEEITWEDWRRQFAVAALLFGLEPEDALYQAFCGDRPPDGETPRSWSAQLPGAYCTVSWLPRNSRAYDESGFEIPLYAASLRINLYESYALYQALKTP